MKKNIAIILAAGKGSRMKSEIPKQFMQIKGKPVLYYSVKAFEDSCIDEIVLVTTKENLEYVEQEIVKKYNFTKVKKVVAGGNERYDSVYKGLCAIDNANTVSIHDGARPCISVELIEKMVEETEKYGACVAGVPVKDTIKIVDENNIIKMTPERKKIWQIQTPQVFYFDKIKVAYEKMMDSDNILVTDDAGVIENYGNMQVRTVFGEYSNIKITTQEDLVLADSFIKK